MSELPGDALHSGFAHIFVMWSVADDVGLRKSEKGEDA
jgi:hypothetical protein